MSAERVPTPELIAHEDGARALARRMGSRPRVAFDLESNGLFAYRARVCTVQLAAAGDVAVLDTLEAPVGALAELLASPGTIKIVHDVAFDARLLAENGVVLANVRDTSVAARMLGRTATGLASLLASELGLPLDKKMQHHDWAERPLTPAGLAYLAADVAHLEALADKLFGEVDARGIAQEVDEETRYRLAQAREATDAPDTRPPYLRLKGIDRAPREDLPILRRIAELREARARDLDVPPYKVLAPDVLFEIARRRPRTMEELARVKGAASGRGRALASDVLRAVARGAAGEAIPPEELAMLERPRPPASLVRARRARERRLTRWRREEAQRRGVDEQVVLPGHCLQDLVDLDPPTPESVAAVPGLGAFRVARDGEAILRAITAPPEDAP